MKYSFDIEKIVSYLEKYKNELQNLYNWNPKLEKLEDLKVLSQNEIYHLNTLKPFEKEIILKEKINERILKYYETDKNKFDNLCLWIIKDWGGILTAKDEGTIKLINEFLQSENPSYKRIASSSKVGSYMYPEKYIIYDSRVAYSLNWIILSQNAGQIFFPIPDGRNSKMSAFDMNVLIRIKNIETFIPKNINELDNRRFINTKDKTLFIPEKEAYNELNSLIKQINLKLWGIEKVTKLYYTEMLLFSIADREIYKDITSKISLRIEK